MSRGKRRGKDANQHHKGGHRGWDFVPSLEGPIPDPLFIESGRDLRSDLFTGDRKTPFFTGYSSPTDGIFLVVPELCWDRGIDLKRMNKISSSSSI